jgi:hypothetical protein
VEERNRHKQRAKPGNLEHLGNDDNKLIIIIIIIKIQVMI